MFDSLKQRQLDEDLEATCAELSRVVALLAQSTSHRDPHGSLTSADASLIDAEILLTQPGPPLRTVG